MVQVNATVTAPEIYKALVAAGEAKMEMPYFKLAVMGLLAGFYVSFGFSFCAASIGHVSRLPWMCLCIGLAPSLGAPALQISCLGPLGLTAC